MWLAWDHTTGSIEREEALMKGKAGLVIGLAAGYVLGTRAGRERFEQIKTQAAKVWELDPVQARVTQVQAFGASALQAVPSALWTGAKRVTSAASASGTPQERVKRASAAAKTSAKDVADAVGGSVHEAKSAAPGSSAETPLVPATPAPSTVSPTTADSSSTNSTASGS